MKIFNLSYSQNIEQYLDAEVKGIRYIKKKTFEKAVKEDDLNYSIAGQTKLKEVERDNKHQLLEISKDGEVQWFLLDRYKFSNIVGYIPVTNDKFIEYKKFNFLFLIFLFAGLLLVIGGLLVGLNWNSWFGPNVTPDIPGGIGYDPGQTDKENNKGNNQTGEVIDFPSITFPGYSALIIPEGKTDLDNISLFNPEKNKDWYDLTFRIDVDIKGDGNYVTIYQSGKVAPGNRINAFTISQPLTAGNYKAKIVMIPYYIKNDKIQLNNGVIEIDLTVK